MKRWLPGRNIAVRLALYFFVVNGIILLVVTLAGSMFTGKLIRKNTQYYAQDYIRSMNNELSFYLRDIDFLTITQFFNQDLTQRLSDNVGRYEMRSSFQSFLAGRDYIVDVFLINKYFQVAGTSSVDYEKLLQSDIYQRILRSDGELVVSPVGMPNFILDTARSGQKVLFVGRKVKNMQRNQVEGEVIVTMRADRIAKIVEKDAKKYDERILVLDRQMRLVYSPNLEDAAPYAQRLEMLADRAERTVLDEGHLFIRASGESDSPLTIAAVIPEKALLKDLAAIRKALTLISIVLLICSIGFALLLSYGFLRPIVKLSLFMRTVSNEALVPYRSKEWKDEIGFLITSFNKMIRRLQESLADIELEREGQRKAELRALQAQINPHFVYNTLNHVRWLARMGRSEPVFDMITSMNEILVGAFRLDQPIITIGEELGYLRQYAHIQSLVHEGKFEIVYDIADSVYDSPIAKLTLQPIVENALFHGILPKNGPGTIRIRAEETADAVLIRISDDGVGTETESAQPENERERVGILNVDKRTKLFFGEQYGISFRSAKGEGTEVTLRLPKAAPNP